MFSAMIRTQFVTCIRVFHANSIGEYILMLFASFFLCKVLLLGFLVLVLMLRMVLLSISIVIFHGLLVLFCSLPLSPSFLG
jgi:hypothetical protein